MHVTRRSGAVLALAAIIVAVVRADDPKSRLDAAHLESRWVYQAESIQFNVPIDPAVFAPRGK